MKKFSSEEIDNFLKLIDPFLNGYSEEVVNRFKDSIKNPKNQKTANKAYLLMTLAESNVKYNTLAREDGIITPDEEKILDQFPPALLPNIKSLLLEAQKQIEEENQQKLSKQPKEPKTGFLQKIFGFLKNPKTLIAASVIMPTSALANDTQSDAKDTKQKVSVYFSPQKYHEALSDVTEIVMQSKNSQKNQVSSTNTKSAPTKSTGGIER